MPLQNTLYTEMNRVLDLLIETTTLLKEGAKHAAKEDELHLLQQKQQRLLSEALKLDQSIKQHFPSLETFTLERQKIHEKLTKFQQINQEFITHLEDHQRIIKKKELSAEIKKMISENNID